MSNITPCNRLDITDNKVRKNKNITPNRIIFLKLVFNDRFTWTNIILKILLITAVFKDCLILIQNEEVHVFTRISTQLLATLQDAANRKSLDLKDLEIACRNYSSRRSSAIFWTDKGKARVVPECLETLRLFKAITKEKEEICSTSAVLYVDYGGLVADEAARKREKERVQSVYFLSEISYEKDIDHHRKHSKIGCRKDCKQFSAKVVSLSKRKSKPIKDAVMSTAFPFTGRDDLKGAFPQQVSSEQETAERSAIVFPNGASFSPAEGHLNRTLSESSQASGVSAKHPEYTDYSTRLMSYGRWTHARPDPTQLSEAGFFFTNQGDLVRCFQCGIGLKDFSAGDNPLNEHAKHSSQCPYLLEHLGQSQLSNLVERLQREDPEMIRQRQLQQMRTTRLEVNFKARHPEYQTMESRLRTFDQWPRQLIQTPRQLTEAGLYYTGVEDQVRCFACDGGLRRWDPEDDPWTEHCRWFPACPFARQQKGDEYINLVQASVDYGNDENNEDLSNAMGQMTLRDPVYKAVLNEHKDTCLEMGYQIKEFNEALQEIRNRGNVLPSIEEILDTIEIVKERERLAAEQRMKQNETPLEENRRLKSFITCLLCGENVNALLLPCSHHRLCMKCAEPLTQCPVCERYIRQKIRTYLV